mgnify:CR=1 FL=1
MIHPSAIISKKSDIHDTANIGPFCFIGDGVTIGENNNLISHVSITGETSIENNNTFYPFLFNPIRFKLFRFSLIPI